MNRLIRFYNQNRYMIWIVVLTTAGIIALLQILNKFAYEKNISNNVNGASIINTSTINSNYSVITGKEVKQDVVEEIEKFISLCNNKQIEKAYEMLSKECKEILYPTLEDFTKNYYNKIFNTKKTYTYQAWITKNNIHTYRVNFTEDMLATGTPSKTSILDYYTFVKNDENEIKLNINNFVGIKNMNNTTTYDNITIRTIRKKIYMDYEIYDIEVLNNTQDTIRLDDLKSTKSVYLEDENNQKYYWYSHEILENDITIRKGVKQEVYIKFNKSYNPNNEVRKMVFSNIKINNKSINMSVDI